MKEKERHFYAQSLKSNSSVYLLQELHYFLQAAMTKCISQQKTQKKGEKQTKRLAAYNRNVERIKFGQPAGGCPTDFPRGAFPFCIYNFVTVLCIFYTELAERVWASANAQRRK